MGFRAHGSGHMTQNIAPGRTESFKLKELENYRRGRKVAWTFHNPHPPMQMIKHSHERCFPYIQRKERSLSKGRNTKKTPNKQALLSFPRFIIHTSYSLIYHISTRLSTFQQTSHKILRSVSSRLCVLRKASVSQRTYIKSICILFSCKFIFLLIIFRPSQGPYEGSGKLFPSLQKPLSSTEHEACASPTSKKKNLSYLNMF